VENDFKFTKLYSEIKVKLNSPYVYGLGERRAETFLLRSGNYTTWNYDSGSMEIYDLHG